MAMMHQNLEVDSYLEARGLMFEKFNRLRKELGILTDAEIQDQIQAHSHGNPTKQDIENFRQNKAVKLNYQVPETQAKLKELLAIKTSFDKAKDSIQTTKKKIEKRKKEIDAEIMLRLDTLLQSPPEAIKSRWSQDATLKNFQDKLSKLEQDAKDKPIIKLVEERREKLKQREQLIFEQSDKINQFDARFSGSAIHSHMNEELNTLLKELTPESNPAQMSEQEKLKKLSDIRNKLDDEIKKNRKVSIDSSIKKYKTELESTYNQQISSAKESIINRQKELAKQVVLENPTLDSKIVQLNQEIKECQQWSPADQRRELEFKYGELGSSSSLMQEVQNNYLDPFQKTLPPQPRKSQQKDSDCEQLIRQKYANYLQQSTKGKSIDYDKAGLGELRQQYLESQKKQAQYKALLPDYISKHLTEQHYIKDKSFCGSKTRLEIERLNHWLNDNQTLKEKDELSQKLKNLGIDLNDKQLDEITAHVNKNVTITTSTNLEDSSWSLSSIWEIGQNLFASLTGQNCMSSLMMGCFSSFWNAIISCCSSPNLETDNDDDIPYKPVQ